MTQASLAMIISAFKVLFTHTDDSPRTALWLVNQDMFLYLDWWPVDRAYRHTCFTLLFRNSNWLPPIGGVGGGGEMNNKDLIRVLLTLCCYSEGDASFDASDARRRGLSSTAIQINIQFAG